MRIDGKRASSFSQVEIAFMIKHRKDFTGGELGVAQLKELHKVYTRRKEVKMNG